MSLYDYESTIQEFYNSREKIEFELLQILKSGKEAQVYLVKYKGKLAALKLFKNHEYRSFKNTATYFSGRYIPSRTLRKAVEKRTEFGLEYIQNEWIAREYSLLKKFHKLGFYVPEPYGVAGSGVLMEYLGDEKCSAPLLKDVHLKEDEAQRSLNVLVDAIQGFFENGFVHGDLSEYNVLWWNDMPYVIDFPQAVESRSNKNARDMLLRDLERVLTFHEKFLPELDKQKYYNRIYEMIRFL